MAPKKKAGGDKKKGAADDDGDSPQDMNQALEHAVDSLKMRLVLEQERKHNSDAAVSNYQSNEKELREELLAQQKETRECVEEMNEQYKRMEKLLQDDITKLTVEVES